MTFNISFIDEAPVAESLRQGQIRIGSFAERFESSIEFWGINDYQSHWTSSIRRVVDERKDSCLITSITDPRTANYIFWWPMYVTGSSSVIIQNQVLFLKECRVDFDPRLPHRSLRSRETVSEDGEQISEWLTSIMELETWLSDRQIKGVRSL